MGYSFPPDLQQLIADRLATGVYQSEDDVLRDALQALAGQEDDLNAVQAALADLKNGDEGIPVEQAFDAIRSRHGISREG